LSSRVNQILAAVIAGDRGRHPLPQLLSRDCADELSIKGVGLALMNDEGHQGVLAATDALARLMEDLQFLLGEGPGTDASRERRPVLQPGLSRTASARWPIFGPAALEAGVAAIFAFPLQVGAIRLGVLDLYRETPGNLDTVQLADALAYADAAVVILLHLQGQMAPGQGLHPQIGDPLASRAEVHQATGVIAVAGGVDLTEALLLLRAHAYATDRPIVLIARDLIAGTIRFPFEPRDHE
jgi:hypothetical protein